MKWLFLIFLMINLAFFSYHYFTSTSNMVTETDTAPKLGPGVGGIVLLEESQEKFAEQTPVELKQKMHVPSTLEDSAVEKKTVLIKSCFQLTGFASFDEAKSNLDKLMDAGFVGAVTEHQVAVLSSYWVLTKRYKSRKEARKVLREMQALSIDSFIIESGDDENAVSVGLFTKMRHALNRKRVLAQHGFEVELKENFRKVTQYKLDIVFRGIKSSPSPKTFIDNVDAQIEVNEKKCQERPK